MPWPLYPGAKAPVPLNRRQGWPPEPEWAFWKNKTSLFNLDIPLCFQSIRLNYKRPHIFVVLKEYIVFKDEKFLEPAG
jgi:hypothetical protein